MTQVSASAIIVAAGVVGLLWAYSQYYLVSKIPVESSSPSGGESEPLTSNGGGNEEKTARLQEIYT
jgi:hypothetical protein